MNTKALVALGAAVLASVAGVALLRDGDPIPAAFIYLLDARRDSSAPLDQALPGIRRLARKYEAKVVVRPAESMVQHRDYRSVFEEFDRTRDPVNPSPILFALDKPYTATKKALRAAVDQSSLQGSSRIQLVKRLVIVRDTEKLNERDECDRLDDDVAYAKWSFLGIGLLVHDATLHDLSKCIEALAPAK